MQLLCGLISYAVRQVGVGRPEKFATIIFPRTLSYNRYAINLYNYEFEMLFVSSFSQKK